MLWTAAGRLLAIPAVRDWLLDATPSAAPTPVAAAAGIVRGVYLGERGAAAAAAAASPAAADGTFAAIFPPDTEELVLPVATVTIPSFTTKDDHSGGGSDTLVLATVTSGETPPLVGRLAQGGAAPTVRRLVVDLSARPGGVGSVEFGWYSDGRLLAIATTAPAVAATVAATATPNATAPRTGTDTGTTASNTTAGNVGGGQGERLELVEAVLYEVAANAGSDGRDGGSVEVSREGVAAAAATMDATSGAGHLPGTPLPPTLTERVDLARPVARLVLANTTPAQPWETNGGRRDGDGSDGGDGGSGGSGGRSRTWANHVGSGGAGRVCVTSYHRAAVDGAPHPPGIAGLVAAGMTTHLTYETVRRGGATLAANTTARPTGEAPGSSGPAQAVKPPPHVPPTSHRPPTPRLPSRSPPPPAPRPPVPSPPLLSTSPPPAAAAALWVPGSPPTDGGAALAVAAESADLHPADWLWPSPPPAATPAWPPTSLPAAASWPATLSAYPRGTPTGAAPPSGAEATPDGELWQPAADARSGGTPPPPVHPWAAPPLTGSGTSGLFLSWDDGEASAHTAPATPTAAHAPQWTPAEDGGEGAYSAPPGVGVDWPPATGGEVAAAKGSGGGGGGRGGHGGSGTNSGAAQRAGRIDWESAGMDAQPASSRPRGLGRGSGVGSDWTLDAAAWRAAVAGAVAPASAPSGRSCVGSGGGSGGGLASGPDPSPPTTAGDAPGRIERVLRVPLANGGGGVAYAVARGGRTLAAGALGKASEELGVPMAAASRTDVASVSKQFTAFLLYWLEHRGELSMDDDVRAHVPELPPYPGATITLRHLVHHVSGLLDYLVPLFLSRGGATDGVPRPLLLASIRRQTRLRFQPGTAWEYSNTNYVLAGLVAERVSGKPLARLLREVIFVPLGMKDSDLYDEPLRIYPGLASSYSQNITEAPVPGGSLAVSRVRAPHQATDIGATGIVTTPADLLRWADNFRNNTLGGGRGLVEAMETPYVLQDANGTALPVDYAGAGGYGGGLFVMDLGEAGTATRQSRRPPKPLHRPASSRWPHPPRPNRSRCRARRWPRRQGCG